MSASDRWGTYKKPCPDCGAVVKYWYFASDDSYSPGSSGIQCKGCKREFTREEWEKIDPSSKRPEPKPDYCGRNCRHRPSRYVVVDKPTPKEVGQIRAEIVAELRKRSFHASCLFDRVEEVGKKKHPKRAWSGIAMKLVLNDLLQSGRVVEKPNYRLALKK
ncbi:MAG: hypothetical protein Q8P49_00550 [Candidatus Liptonbacteria bacterium]|nr:hypothetical protein [Candidatus Liptonbacteria bacterium]